jgi:putative Mn2+ efflux pump MntP
MSFIELFLLSTGLSMDAFAVAVCAGLGMPGADMKKTFVVGLYFGAFQAAMPLIGYLFGTQFAGGVINYGHWIAFALLSFLGGKMIAGSFKKDECRGGELTDIKEFSVNPARMLPLAIATSIDALAVGVSFAFLRVSIVPAVSFIGLVTFVISMWGVKIGQTFGATHKSKAELAGGVILILIGLKIFLEHIK